MKYVVVGIISRKREDGQEEYLLIKSRKDFGSFSGFYYPPGGHINSGETTRDALVREIYEELSMSVIPVRQVAETPGDVEGQITYWWLCETQNENIKIQADEIAEASYFTAEDMKNMDIWPATRNFFNKYIFQK